MGYFSRKGRRAPLKRKTLVSLLIILSLAFAGSILVERFFTQEIEQFVLGVQTEE